MAGRAMIPIILIVFFLITTKNACCPTCIGRVEQSSPPFFTKEFYNKPENKKLLEDAHYTKK
jgi:hypothetical protein